MFVSSLNCRYMWCVDICIDVSISIFTHIYIYIYIKTESEKKYIDECTHISACSFYVLRYQYYVFLQNIYISRYQEIHLQMDQSLMCIYIYIYMI